MGILIWYCSKRKSYILRKQLQMVPGTFWDPFSVLPESPSTHMQAWLSQSMLCCQLQNMDITESTENFGELSHTEGRNITTEIKIQCTCESHARP